MNIGFAILCRYTSSRLPGKILADVGGHTVLRQIHDRVQRGAPGLPVVVATSEDVTDDAVAEYCDRSGITCYRGSLSNVAARFLGCAKASGWETIFRINGDNLFASPAAIRQALREVRTGSYDFVTNVKGRTYPTGMSVEAVKTGFYERVYEHFESAAHFEHVTSYLYEHEEVGRRCYLTNTICAAAAGTHFALDTRDDLVWARRLLQKVQGEHLRVDLPGWWRLRQEGDAA